MESIGIRNILDMKCDLSSEQTHTIGANRSQTQNKVQLTDPSSPMPITCKIRCGQQSPCTIILHH